MRIGSADDYLLLTSDESDPIVQTLTAELSSSGLRAIRTVVHSYRTGFADLADFFAQLEQDWRGWDDARSWRSLEGDLGIEARHEFRHVQLRVTLRAYGPGWGNDGWKASANLTIDPGEQLSQIAADLSRLTTC
ncbi:MAG TPA: DUF6228 family protein [Streptosporangiaceae bacterium]